MKKFTFEEIQIAFANQDITLKDFALILADNFGKKRLVKYLGKIWMRNLSNKGLKRNCGMSI